MLAFVVRRELKPGADVAPCKVRLLDLESLAQQPLQLWAEVQTAPEPRENCRVFIIIAAVGAPLQLTHHRRRRGARS